MTNYKKLSLFFSLIVFFSCVDNLDFDQIDEYTYAPVYTSSLAYFKILPVQFFDVSGTIPVSEIIDETEFRIFDTTYIRDNIIRLAIDIETKNEIDSDFLVQINFLDDNNLITHQFNTIRVSANNLNHTFNESVQVSTNQNLLNTTKVSMTIRLDNPSPPLNPSDSSELELKSSITIYLDSDV